MEFSFKKSVLSAGLILLVSVSAHAWEAKTFKKPSGESLKTKLTDLQYKVTQKDHTEKPFENEYWNQKEPGIYVDVVSGEPLFSSIDKYDSGTGWPSFTKALVPANIITKVDRSIFSERVEVRSRYADSHLGHVFDDCPPPTGKRFCMNSAALKFVAAAKLSAEGYAEFSALFSQSVESKTSAKAIFAGGCFWCMQPPFDVLKSKGVISSRAGYIGGKSTNPNYDEVSSGKSGHNEAVEIVYDPKKITFAELNEVFWKNIDPYDEAGQFCDKGSQYLSAIYVANDDERGQAEKLLDKLIKEGKLKAKVATKILAASAFYPAEEYHQDYYLKNPIRYKLYRGNCGRDKRLKEVWGAGASH